MQEDFGQEVILTVHNSEGDKVVFDAAGLRVDFDVRLINGFSRGTFTIYNIKEATIKAISNGENYVTVKTKLHGRQEFTVANSFFVSNVLEEKKLPNSITTLYCYDKLRKQFLENVVDITVKDTTLRKEISTICSVAGFKGKINFQSFPSGKLDQVPPNSKSPHHGTAQQCLRRLQTTHRFNMFTDIDIGITCMYLPTVDELKYTELADKPSPIVLDVNNMRANPKIGPATLFVTSNLDGNIRPASVIDISEMLTVGVEADERVIQIANGFLKNTVAGFSRYQVLTVQHTGSNFTSLWKTIATASSPSVGKNMPTLSWHKGT